ncbi:hypothetical protein [Chryseobacterium sp. JUb7]|uniref:hypothetical protein n=1 Tax=Chryseobacterium sp. JUb7 TaxID=2940599 RepID=UPI00216A07B6|nr:hypothetical protein [Chryseobacterium sp. JUb7]MCS3532706.1 hypothetical protein [Chryseobacterium sp. JUb7]
MRFLLSIVFLLSVVTSCTQNDDETLEKNVNSVDVYVAGIENSKACYWKNNQQTYLSSGDGITPSDIIVENDNIYIVGYSQFTNELNYFWKNNTRFGIRQYLNIAAGLYARIEGFYIYNNDIYFSGVVENPSPATPNEKYEYCYWKNGIKTILDTFPDYYFGYSSLGSVCVYNSQVYNTGRKIINSLVYDGYYEGTTFHPVINIADEYGDLIGNLVSNANNLYISYRKNYIVSYKNIITGTETTPNQPISNLNTPITLDGNDVYLMQYQSYYKNGNLNPINVDPEFELCYDMFILNQNLYSVRAVDFQNRGGKIYINNVQTYYLPPAPVGTKQILKAIFAVQN